ncbi:MAG: hypothetical protein IJD97_01055 [Clostridia bacterium]|nr:hypothetical protein [Clostridia bacterium]
MIFFINLAEILLVAYSGIRGVAYGIWNIKEKNRAGGILCFFLSGLVILLFILKLYKQA